MKHSSPPPSAVTFLDGPVLQLTREGQESPADILHWTAGAGDDDDATDDRRHPFPRSHVNTIFVIGWANGGFALRNRTYAFLRVMTWIEMPFLSTSHMT
jgi:hypothetical protein